MISAPLKQERSEYGKLHRKEYEQGSRNWGGRTAMKRYVPKPNNKSETITTIIVVALQLELYEVDSQAQPIVNYFAYAQ